MDKGDFVRDFADFRVPSKKSKVPIQSVGGEEGAREAQRNALVLTLKAPFDFTRFKVCTVLPKMK